MRIEVDSAAIGTAAGEVEDLGKRVGASTPVAEPALRELAWTYPGAHFADAAGDDGRSARQALDDLQVALASLAIGLHRAAATYAEVEAAATSGAHSLMPGGHHD
jgi:hypothetical protein